MSIQEKQNDKLKSHRPDKYSFLKEFAQSEPTPTDEYKAFSFGRVGTRTQPMITFVKNDGYVEAIAYACLNRVWSSDIDHEIKLDFDGRQVTIEGSNLTVLFRYIRSNRCSEILESSYRDAILQTEESPHVSRISMEGR